MQHSVVKMIFGQGGRGNVEYKFRFNPKLLSIWIN